jgi:tetratricopeptide (TPR) repeat protein
MPPRLRKVILAKAEGNPFYMEEVIRALIAMGALVRDKATGGWRSAARVEEITVPDTIQGVIMARVDRLDEDLKQVLKLASVIGRSFFYRVLRAISEAERELDRHLAELQHVEFIRERRRIPELEFIFKHALVQETTYDSILVDRRRQLHRQVGECVEALFPDRLEDFYGLLAYHYARAEDPRKAHEYLLKAGDQAGKVAADAEALPHYRQALAIYERMLGDRWDPLERAVLERKIGEALFRRGEHQQAIEYLQRSLSYLGTPSPTSRWGIRLSIAGQLGQQAGHRLLPSLFLRHAARRAGPTAEERVRIYELMSWIDYFMDLERLVLDVLLLLNISERSGLSVGMVQGNMAVGLICDLIPAFRLAEHYHNRAVALAEKIQHPLAIAQAYLGLAVHEYNLGKWETALEHARGAGAAYREAGDLRGWGLTTQMIAWLLRLRGDFTQSLGQSQEVVRVGQDAGDHQVWAWGLHGCGRTLWHTGALDEAITYLQHAIELYKAIPDYQTVAEATSDLGECYLSQGKLTESLAALEESNQLIALRGLRGVHCTRPRNGLAEAYLVMADRAEERERARWLRKAKQACRAALKQSKTARQGMAGACRLQGTYEWLGGRPTVVAAEPRCGDGFGGAF